MDNLALFMSGFFTAKIEYRADNPVGDNIGFVVASCRVGPDSFDLKEQPFQCLRFLGLIQRNRKSVADLEWVKRETVG